MNFPGLGGDSEDGDTKDKDEEAERERLEAIKEAEERRKEKHRKMEEEREKMRQDIRDKVGHEIKFFKIEFKSSSNFDLYIFRVTQHYVDTSRSNR